MVVIRLARGGAKKRPFYKIVVADSRKPLKGRFIEKIGYYNPFAVGGETRIFCDVARLDSWTAQGAQLSDRLSLVIKEFKKIQALEPKAETAKPSAPMDIQPLESGSETQEGQGDLAAPAPTE